MSEPLGVSGYESKGFSRIAVTKRVYFSVDVTSPASVLTEGKVLIDYEQLKDMCDFENIVAEAGGNYDPFNLFNVFGTLEIAAVAYEKSPQTFTSRNGSTFSTVVVSPTASKVRTFAGGDIAAVENFTRTLPDTITYSVSGTNSVYPIVATVNFGPSFQGLEIGFNLVWDDYTATPLPLKIAGYVDVNIIPQLLYSPA